MSASIDLSEKFTIVESLNKVLAADAESMLDFAYKRNLLNGIVIGILKQGEAYVRTAGTDIDANSCLEIGSVTKTFTAELVNTLVEQGVLRWEDSFGLYLPETLKRYDEIKQASKSISLLDLATHRAGLPLLPENLKITDGLNPYGYYGLPEIARYLEEDFLVRPISKRYIYSNFGFALLGYAVGNVTKTAYPELLQRQLLEPLGLSNTSLAISGSSLTPIVAGYTETGKPAARWTQLAFAPTGALCSTVGDQLKWIRYLVDDANRAVFKRYAVGRNEYVGLGWKYDPLHNAYERDGMTGGFCSYISVNTDKRWGVVVLSNRKGIDIVRAMAKNFERSLEGIPMRPMRGSYGSVRAHFIEGLRNNKMTYYLGRKVRGYLKQ